MNPSAIKSNIVSRWKLAERWLRGLSCPPIPSLVRCGSRAINGGFNSFTGR